MVTISSNSTGTTYLNGTISGLDTAALINTAVTAKLKPADRLDDQISTNTTKISAYTDLQTYSNNVTTALNKLKSGGSAITAKQVTTKSSDAISADTVLSASVTSNASSGTYRVVVQQLAQAMSVNGATQTSNTTALGLSGTFDLGLAGGTAATISITATMSLKDIADMINAVAGNSGVEATIMRTGSGYALVLTGNETAKPFTVANITGDNVLQSLGITDSSGNFSSIAQEPKQAMITLNGTTITSDSNTLENVLDGLTLSLENAAPSTTISVTVGNNVNGIEDALQEFVDAYNTLHSYLVQNQKVTDGAVSSYAYLYAETVLRNMSQQISGIITANYGNGDYNSLGAIGITLDSSNKMVLDSESLSTALSSNYGAVIDFLASGSGFADTLYTSIDRYAGTNGVISERITALQTENGDLTLKSDTIKERVNAYEQQLITRYSAMETRILTANILKKQIAAILEGSSKSNE